MENSMLIQKRESKKTSTESLQKSHVIKVKRVIAEGQLGKVLKLLLSDGLINPSQEVVEEMLAKHPQNPPPSLPSDPAPPSPEIPEAMVLKAVQSFPTGSAPGPSVLRTTHLKEAILCPFFSSASWALQSLSAFVNKFGAGRSPPEVTPHLCGPLSSLHVRRVGAFAL